MARKVLVTEKISETGYNHLLQNNCEIVDGSGKAEDIIAREAAGCDAILTRNGEITRSLLQANPQLQVVAMHGVGVDNIDVPAATELGVYITNTPGANSNSVAEFALSLILALAKHLVLYHNHMQAGNWGISRVLGGDIKGKTLGIVGVGNIGRLTAQKAAALGMQVLAYKRGYTGEGPALGENITLTANLDEVMAKADFVSLHVPFTPGTENLISAEKIALMKPTAYLVNTARGEVIDNAALYKAVESKKIAGAALDVFVGGYPDPADPLLHSENILVTPHVAAFTHSAVDTMSLYAAMGVIEALDGKKPSFAVNQPQNCKAGKGIGA
ncbi:MAG: hydroxyacid dehydrogenase [Oscillospiraceae bacterium]